MTKPTEGKKLPHLDKAKQKGAAKQPNHHVHVVYSNGSWGNREWQYRIYSIEHGKKPPTTEEIRKHIRKQAHHGSLATGGWHVETHRLAHPKDMDKTQGQLNSLIIKHAEKDASIRKRLTAAEKPPEKKKK